MSHSYPPEYQHELSALGKAVGIASISFFPEGKKPESLFGVHPVLLKAQNAGMKDVKIYASLVGQKMGDEAAKFLETTDLVEGVDYFRNHGGMRGGNRYFDFVTPESISKLQATLQALPPANLQALPPAKNTWER